MFGGFIKIRHMRREFIVIVIIVLLGIFSFAVAVDAIVRVRGYYRQGYYVMPYYRSSPNSTKYDNWSTKGNINPFTGQKGYKSIFSY
jgi:hypothetical protein